MLRALVAVALLGGIASAEDVEDPKAAIAERGIVLKAGKRNFFVLVPAPETSDGSTIYKSTLYFGDAKTLVEYGSRTGTPGKDYENQSLADDPRFIYDGLLERKGTTYTFVCGTTFRDGTPPRRLEVTLGDTKAVAKATIKERVTPRLGYFLARLQGTTTYLYIDRRGAEMRLLLGKRGALKQVPIKEVADDATSLVAVTAKGVLTIKKSERKDVAATATWGPAKKAAPVDVLPMFQNRKLIYQELGIYTREPLGYPCEEL
jgi:hypothetical protein